MKKVLILIAVLISIKGYSCSCIEQGKIGNYVYSEYTSIVLGEVVKIEFENTDSIFQFIHLIVQESFHGDNKDTIVIKADYQAGMCAIWPNIGDTWLFFSKGEIGHLWTTSCFRTKSLNPDYYNYEHRKKELKKDLKFLRKRNKTVGNTK